VCDAGRHARGVHRPDQILKEINMRNALRWWGGVAVAVAGLATGAALAAPAKNLTVGDLAVRLARTASVRLPAANPEQAAARFLGRQGISLGDDLSRPATGADLVQIGRRLGTPVSTSQPEAPVTAAQGAAFVGAVRGSLYGSEEAGGNGADKEGGINASCQGREARDGRKGTPASPADPNATAPPCTGDEPQP
jgi:hypothetical protein